MDKLILFAAICFVAYLVFTGIHKAIQNLIKHRRQKRLDKIACDVLAGFDSDKEREEIKSLGSKYVPEVYRCPVMKCNGMLILREGIYGNFLGCNHYPDCNFFSLIKENEKTKFVRVQDVYKIYDQTSRCPKCNGVLVLRDGTHGKFLGCSRYPMCKYTRGI